MVPNQPEVSCHTHLRNLSYLCMTTNVTYYCSNLHYYNGVRLPDGRVPTVTDIANNASLNHDPTDLSTQSSEAEASYLSEKWMKAIGDDLFAAHQKALEEGYDDWSEWGYIHNKMGKSLNATAFATGGDGESQIFGTMYDDFTFASTKWKTIDRGLNRLPQAFGPVLGDKVTFNTRVTKIDFDGEKVSVQWKKKPYDTKYESREYENLIVAVPFSIVRTWHLPSKQFVSLAFYTQSTHVLTCYRRVFIHSKPGYSRSGLWTGLQNRPGIQNQVLGAW
jgi:hypothetical protein